MYCWVGVIHSGFDGVWAQRGRCPQNFQQVWGDVLWWCEGLVHIEGVVSVEMFGTVCKVHVCVSRVGRGYSGSG